MNRTSIRRVCAMKLALCLLVAVLAGASLAQAQQSRESSPQAPPISLTVTSTTGRQPQTFSPDLFKGVPGSRLQLTATLTNTSSSPVTVSINGDYVINVGSIWVLPLSPVGFTEGPLPALLLRPARMDIRFEDDP